MSLMLKKHFEWTYTLAYFALKFMLMKKELGRRKCTSLFCSNVNDDGKSAGTNLHNKLICQNVGSYEKSFIVKTPEWPVL
jgi:hypothetical protein